MAINSRFTKDYVVFMKATSDIWQKMPDAQKQANALYFVVDGPEDDVGRLYLGNTLIADGSGITEMGVEQLSDVKLSNINTGDILVYNLNSKKWENMSFENYLGDFIQIFEGATATQDGKAGLVPVPTVDDINKYLQGNGTWGDPTVKVREDLSSLTAQVKTLIGTDVDASVRSIATGIAADAASAAVTRILDNAPEAFDTLKEVATWIEKHPSAGDFTALNNRVGNLEDILRDSEDEETGETIPGLVSVVNNLKLTSTDLTGRVEVLETKATDASNAILKINTDLNDYKGVLAQHTTQITEINERLTWQELYEEITA